MSYFPINYTFEIATPLFERHTQEVTVVSIPHSGTRSVMSALNCAYHHVHEREDPNWQGFTERLLVCPLREPKAVWRSWVKRWNAKKGEVALHLFEKQYRHLEALDAEYDFFYLPVDRPNQHLLDELSERLSRTVRLEKIGSMDASAETDHAEPDWKYIYELPMIGKTYLE